MLSVTHLYAGYGEATVLHDINFELKSGEVLFIVGRNGAGKTTLLKAIAGLVKPSGGRIVFRNLEINGLPPEQIARIGVRYVNQEKKVFTELTVRSNIELAAFGAGVPKTEAMRIALEVFPGLDKLMELPAGKLSGGQREMLLIARALCVNPQLVLIDEPTEGLAAIVIKDIYDVFKKMKARLSAIIVEQNLSLVSELADRVLILREGKIIRELKEKSEFPAIEQFEACL